MLSGARRTRPGVLAFLALAVVLVMGALASSAFAASQNVALIPNAGENEQGGGSPLPTSGFPNGYAPTFTDVSFVDLENPAGPDPLAGKDTAVLVTCNTGELMTDPTSKSRLQNFVTNGGKLLMTDAECNSPPPDYSNFFFPFESSNPGGAGATGGTLNITEDSTLASPNSASASFIDGNAIGNDTDAIGDANVMTTFNENWCLSIKAANSLGTVGPVETYAHMGSGLIVWWGLDTDYLDSVTSYDASSTSGADHLGRIWLLQLLQPVNPDGLPCGVKIFGIALSPRTASNPVGTTHTVKATVTQQGDPQPNVAVTFTVTDGPNKGQTGSGTTDTNGQTSYTYTDTGGAGTDTITATATIHDPTGAPHDVSDTAQKTWVAPPAPAAPQPTPKIAVAGVRRACISHSTRLRVSLANASSVKTVKVFLDGKRILTTSKTTFSLRINAKKLKAGRHRIRTVAYDASGKVVATSRRTIARCAVAKPKRKVAPRFTG